MTSVKEEGGKSWRGRCVAGRGGEKRRWQIEKDKRTRERFFSGGLTRLTSESSYNGLLGEIVWDIFGNYCLVCMSVCGARVGLFKDPWGVSFEGVLIGLLALGENKLLPSLPPRIN